MSDILREKWEKGKKECLRFYELKLKWKEEQFNHKFSLPVYLAPMIGDKKEVLIADLGAGMFSTMGCYWYGATVKVYPSDILAEEFRKILEKHQVVPIFPVEKQDMEKLTYKDESFDIVHCVNALDHCVNPGKAIQEMIRVCKTGGWIYLRHCPNNGEERNYEGLHHWNMYPTVNDDCLFWTKIKIFLLKKIDSRFHTEMKKEVGNEPEMIVSKLHKEITQVVNMELL